MDTSEQLWPRLQSPEFWLSGLTDLCDPWLGVPHKADPSPGDMLRRTTSFQSGEGKRTLRPSYPEVLFSYLSLG